MNRITFEIAPKLTQWRACIYVDGHRVAKSWFSTRQAAMVWVDEQVAALAMEVK